jgi:hypothetical protein
MLNYCDTATHNYTQCFFIKGAAHRNICSNGEISAF